MEDSWTRISLIMTLYKTIVIWNKLFWSLHCKWKFAVTRNICLEPILSTSPMRLFSLFRFSYRSTPVVSTLCFYSAHHSFFSSSRLHLILHPTSSFLSHANFFTLPSSVLFPLSVNNITLKLLVNLFLLRW